MAKTLNGIESEFGFHTDNAPDEVKSNQVWLAIYEMAVGHEVTAYGRERQAKRALAEGVVRYGSSELKALTADYQKSMQMSFELATVLTMLVRNVPIGYTDNSDMIRRIMADARTSFEEDC